MAIGVNARTAFSLLFPPILDEFGWERGLTAGAFAVGFVVSTPFLTLARLAHGPPRGAGADAARRAHDGERARAGHPDHASVASLPSPWASRLGRQPSAWAIPARAVPAPLVRAPARSRHGHRVLRRGDRLHRAVAVGAAPSSPRGAGGRPASGSRWSCSPCWIPLNAIFPRRRPGGHRALARRRLGSNRPALPRSRPSISWIPSGPPPSGPWLAPHGPRASGGCSSASSLGSFAWYAIQVHQTRYLIDIGFRPEPAAYALGMVALAGVVGQIAMGHLWTASAASRSGPSAARASWRASCSSSPCARLPRPPSSGPWC